MIKLEWKVGFPMSIFLANLSKLVYSKATVSCWHVKVENAELRATLQSINDLSTSTKQL